MGTEIDVEPSNKGAAFEGKFTPPFVLDYPIRPRPRWTTAAPYPFLIPLFESARPRRLANLLEFSRYHDYFARIEATEPEASVSPRWTNGFIPGLDAIALYSFLVKQAPRTFFEIGSGNSTKFARRAISDHGLATRILSLDPEPQQEMDTICDELLRVPLEECDLPSVLSRF